MKIAITGHRPNKLGNDYDLTSDKMKSIKEIIRGIVTNRRTDLTMITGMALGIDTLFAMIAIEENIAFIAAIPFGNQPKLWPTTSKLRWSNILSNELCTIHNVSGQSDYKFEYMQKRNEWMVDNCDILIAVWDGTPGGTANCVKYAKEACKNIIHIDPKALIIKATEMIPAIPPEDYSGSVGKWMAELQVRGLWDGEGWYGDVFIPAETYWDILKQLEK